MSLFGVGQVHVFVVTKKIFALLNGLTARQMQAAIRALYAVYCFNGSRCLTI